MNIDKRLLAYKPISVTLNFDWDKMSYDERVLARHNHIEEQKKKDPNYVGYDFLEHFSSLHAGGSEKSVHITDFSRIVSTLGQVIRIFRNKVYTTFGWNAKGYRVIELGTPNNTKEIKVHRIIGCTFIPIPDDLKEIREKIVINHKNDIRSCNLRSNLEWVTHVENIIKAVDTGAIPSTPFKFTITRPGPYFGKVYYFTNVSSLKEHGFAGSGVYISVNKDIPYLCGKWSAITKEELDENPTGITKDVIDYIRDPKHGTVAAKGNVGTITSEGPCKGEWFVIYGSAQLKLLGFDPCTVTNCTLGKLKTHKGCAWVKRTRAECVNIPIGLTEEQKKHIFG